MREQKYFDGDLEVNQGLPRPRNYGSGYLSLFNATKKGEVDFRWFVAGHGTVGTRLLLELGGHFDILFLEPDSLLLNGYKGKVVDTSALYDIMWETIQATQRRIPDRPVKVLVKVLGVHWQHQSAGRELFDLDHRPIFIIRHPSLCIESWLSRQGKVCLDGGDRLDPLNSGERGILTDAIERRTYSSLSYETVKKLGAYLFLQNPDLSESPDRYEAHDIQKLSKLPYCGRDIDRASDGFFDDAQDTRLIAEFTGVDHLREQIAKSTFWDLALKNEGNIYEYLRLILDGTDFQYAPRQVVDDIMTVIWSLKPNSSRNEAGHNPDIFNPYEGENLATVRKHMFSRAFDRGTPVEKPHSDPLPLSKLPPCLREAARVLTKQYYVMTAISAMRDYLEGIPPGEVLPSTKFRAAFRTAAYNRQESLSPKYWCPVARAAISSGGRNWTSCILPASRAYAEMRKPGVF